MAAHVYRRVQADPTSYISPAAGIIGSVTIGAASSVFAGAQLRGDCGQTITIGARTNIQEGVLIHVSPENGTIIGDGVTLGHGAIIHGCTIEDDVLVGMGATVLDGATIRRGSLVGAGALVTSGKDFPENSLILGSPARAVRTLSEQDVETMIRANAREYIEVGNDMVAEGMMFNPDETFTFQIGA